MPNWVYNTVTIKGDDMPLALFKQRVKNPYKTVNTIFNTDSTTTFVEDEVDEVFSFWNIIKPSAEELYEYNHNVDGIPFWWGWNVANWGTKWDACETSIVEDKVNLLQYRFDTAWAMPMPVMVEASKQYKDLTFHIHYEEEQGWGGEVTLINGEVISEKFWDVPESHKDYEYIGDECLCGGDGEKVFDDCPSK